MPLPVFGQQLIDLFGGVPDFVDRYVVIQSVDNACQIFAHFRRFVPGPCDELRCPVGQVGRDDLCYIALLIIFIKFAEAVCEESEGGAYKYILCAAFFYLLGDIQHAFAGRDHIIDNDDILPGYGIAEEFMGDDRIFPLTITE